MTRGRAGWAGEGKRVAASRWLCRRACLCLAGALALAIGALGERRAQANTPDVKELVRILTEDGSYKVRVQAALVLGKLADRDAVPGLQKALRDSNNTVRAVAAQALGRIGAPEAVGELRSALKVEKNAFVRTQLERALASLERPAAGAGGGSKVYIELGAFTGGARSADAGALAIFREALRRRLSTMSRLTFELAPEERAGFERSGRRGFLIDGNVTRLDTVRAGSGQETNCDVKVMVARWPSKSIISWTTAGAAVQGGGRDRDREVAVRDCLEASAEQVGEDLKRFFEAQGS